VKFSYLKPPTLFCVLLYLLLKERDRMLQYRLRVGRALCWQPCRDGMVSLPIFFTFLVVLADRVHRSASRLSSTRRAQCEVWHTVWDSVSVWTGCWTCCCSCASRYHGTTRKTVNDTWTRCRLAVVVTGMAAAGLGAWMVLVSKEAAVLHVSFEQTRGQFVLIVAWVFVAQSA
jgi:hypothetical protein